jgi:hypothetical protein
VIISLARRLLLFYELCAYISLGVHRKVYSGHCLRISRTQGVPVSAGIRNGIRISWRCGMTAGSGFAAAASRAPAPGSSTAGWPRAVTRCLTAARRAGETALKMPAGLRSACSVRDRPQGSWPPRGGLKRTCLTVPACRPERKAAQCQGRIGPGVNDVSVAAGGGSSRMRAARVAGGVTGCAAGAARRHRAASRVAFSRPVPPRPTAPAGRGPARAAQRCGCLASMALRAG